jgi:hypothetical protein
MLQPTNPLKVFSVIAMHLLKEFRELQRNG